jgi:hypothetical protein
MKNRDAQVSPKNFTAAVLCDCGKWINVTGAGNEEPCWKCNGKVKFFLSGSTPVGKTMGFMKFEWVDTQAQSNNSF